ncbi:MAG TPA: carboxypeptidase-like regulatory domain-containing protein [Polyangia bacterium]|nr:carboxypeptidase-like regulatory domain-containing protein [Polyangia bacterium]
MRVRTKVSLALLAAIALASAATFVGRGRRHEQAPAAAAAVGATGRARLASSTLPPLSPIVDAAHADPLGTLRLEGQVIDAEQQPVGGATVVLSTVPPRSVRSEADGSFVFTGLAPRTLALSASVDERVAGPAVVALTERTEPVILRVQGATTVEVLAFDVLTQRAIAGATVEVREPLPMQATTGVRGVARLRGVGAGPHQVVVTAPGYAPSFPTLVSNGRPGTVQSLVVTMHPGGAVSGRVVDAEGHPVAGATVTGESAARGEPLVDARAAPVTDAEGRWRIAAVAAGTVRFAARDGHHAPGSSALLSVDGKAARDDVEIVMSRGGRIAGHVVGRDGKPVAGASVRAALGGGKPEALAEVRCDSDGAFAVTGLPLRTVELLAVGAEATSRAQSFDLSARDEEPAARLVLDVDATIAGMVVAADGTPVPEAQVSALPDERGGDQALRDPPMTVSDGGGRFTLRGLPDGAYRVRASFASAGASARASAVEHAHSGDREVRVVLASDGAIVGEVAFADESAPDFFQVRLDSALPVPFRATRSFRMPCPAGHHVLSIQGPGFRERVVPSVEVHVGQDENVGLLRLDRGRTLRGRVITSAGSGVGGARVTSAALLIGDGSSLGAATGAAGIGRIETTSNADGSFVLSGLGDQALAVVAEHASLGRSTPTPVGADHDPPAVTLVLLPLGSLEGAVTRGGKPLENAVVAASSRAQGQARFFVRSGPDGHYRFDRLSPDDYTIAAGDSDNQLDQRITTRFVHVGEGAAHLDVDLPSGVASCRVRLTAPPREVVNAQVYLASGTLSARAAGDIEQSLLQRPDGTVNIGHILHNGSVTFDQLASGAYTLCTVALRGDLSDPVVAQRIREGASSLPVTCQALQLAASPTPLDVVVPVQPL